jgi:hypothetical protein
MKTTNRRGFLKLTGLGIVAASVSKFFSPTHAGAQTPQLVNEKDPLAQSLGYHHDTKKVDNKKWPKHAGEGSKQKCADCMFYQTKDAKGAEAPCQIFAGKLVKGAGWCNSWAKKA